MADNSPSHGSQTQSNPYAPPSADLAELPAGADASAVALRFAHLAREKAIKRIAWINLVVAIIWWPAAVGSLLMLALAVFHPSGYKPNLPFGLHPGLALAGVALLHVGVFSLNVALFLGLRRLRVWARWTMVGLTTIALIVLCLFLFVAFNEAVTNWSWYAGNGVTWVLIAATVFYVLLTPPSGRIFTREYRNVVAQTRELRI